MSIHYPFPQIRHIDDVLPHIDDKSFGVKEKDCGHTFINYLRMGDETFPPIEGTQADRHRAAIRRECRGIAFNTETGKLASRPFHKFFNIGENENLSTGHMGFHMEHVVMDKVDGSMIRPLWTAHGLRWGTKAGVTDTSNLAEVYTQDKPWYEKMAMRYMGSGRTPIFEYVSPENRIVVDYGKREMVLIAIRDNLTGTYFEHSTLELIGERYGIPVVRIFDPVEGDAETWLENVKGDDGLDEGVVVAWINGHRAKAKTVQYSILHKIKEKASTERNLITAVLEEEVDDLLPLVPEEDRKGIETFTKDFWRWLDSFAEALQVKYDLVRAAYDTKKDFALASEDWNRVERAAVFTLWDGKEDTARAVTMNIINAALVTETKWAEFRANTEARMDMFAPWKEGVTE